MRFIAEALLTNVHAYIAKDSKPANLVNAIVAVANVDGVFLGETLPRKELLKAFGDEINLRKRKPHELNPITSTLHRRKKVR